jgi:hypothetical protein
MADTPLILVHIMWRASYSQVESSEFRGKIKYYDKKAGEALNFCPRTDGKCWAYMAIAAGGQWWPDLSLEKIDYNARSGDKVDGATVVFTAPDPSGGDRVVVGWYKNATVFRKAKQWEHPSYISANQNDCVELPEQKRTFKIKGAQRARAQAIRGRYPGTSPIFYASYNNPGLASSVAAYIAEQDSGASKDLGVDPLLLQRLMAVTGKHNSSDAMKYAIHILQQH